jgi:neutral ceramidase
VKKRLLLTGAVLVALLAGAVLLIGPWPAYSSVDVTQERYYQRNVDAIRASAARSTIGGQPGPFRAGWAQRSIVPPPGTPLAGFGDRKGKPSTGVHDEIFVKALVLADGNDKTALIAADMLIIPENLAEIVRERVLRQTGLTADVLLFNATHTHSGPGGWAPGFVGKQFAGTYDATVLEFLAQQFTDAIVEADANADGGAALGAGSVPVEACIRNRTRDAPCDTELSYLLVKKDDGARCLVVSYSAHPTVLGGSNMEFSGDYPGYLVRTLERETAAFTIFLGGAVGSMSVRYSGHEAGFDKAKAIGEELARHVLERVDGLELRREVEVASVGVPLELPSMQWRIHPSWRLSPFLVRFLGINSDGWLQCVRVGDVYFAGMPSDFSGEISVRMKAWADSQGIDLWVLSFNGDYVGYVSPDEYYAEARPDGKEAYEMYLMNWCGPNQEAFFTHLTREAVAALSRSTASGS